MKILIVHNRYQQRGGEDTVVETELALLRDSGVEANLHTIHNNSISGVAGALRTFLGMKNNAQAIAPAIAKAKAFGADLIHVHNFFPLFSPGLHVRLYAAGFPVVQTLHNYRLLCVNGMFLRDDRVCEDCLTRGRQSALIHRCYRNSLLGTAAVLRMQNAAVRDVRWQEALMRVIALTQFQRDKLIEGGLRADRIVVKGNSVEDPGEPPQWQSRQGLLFVGRIDTGKGADLIVESARDFPDLPVTIAGDGPELDKLRAGAPDNVRFLGRVPRQTVYAQMQTARFLVLPSTWYEGFPMTIVEALACGLPVLASRIGGIPEIIPDGEAGFLFEPGNLQALREAIAKGIGPGIDTAFLSAEARRRYKVKHSPQANLEALLRIYGEAVNQMQQTR